MRDNAVAGYVDHLHAAVARFGRLVRCGISRASHAPRIAALQAAAAVPSIICGAAFKLGTIYPPAIRMVCSCSLLFALAACVRERTSWRYGPGCLAGAASFKNGTDMTAYIILPLTVNRLAGIIGGMPSPLLSSTDGR